MYFRQFNTTTMPPIFLPVKAVAIAAAAAHNAAVTAAAIEIAGIAI
ncbi:hypothetical protein [Psychromonas ingrahamii]|nr:hypothetical protein [Psychromonas ingrahamii]